MKIVVAGLGYVGLPLACALARRHQVVAIDVNSHRVNSINRGQSSLAIPGIDAFLSDCDLDLVATIDAEQAYSGADLVIVAVSTDFDALTSHIDTSAVDDVVGRIAKHCPDALVVIRSTVPVGFTEALRERSGMRRMLCSPEFLRESDALHDMLNPTRIVIGTDMEDDALVEDAERFGLLMRECVEDEDVPVVMMGMAEAEATKLFSNAYLALRVAFFNELDTYAECAGLNARQIIEGMRFDPRIGRTYNNPGFGFGGYCLPKDTRQLLAAYQDMPQKIITAISESNSMRKDHIVDEIAERIDEESATVGVFRLVMESEAIGLRHSSLLGIVQRLQRRGVSVILYEPLLGNAESFLECPVVNDLRAFKGKSDLIVANRYNHCLDDVSHKIYTRDAFGSD